MRRVWVGVVLAIGAATLASPARSAEDNGMAVHIPADKLGFVFQMKEAIRQSGRFQLIPTSGLSILLNGPELTITPPLTVPVRNAMRKRTTARWLLLGTVGKHTVQVEIPGGFEATTSIDVSTRVLDLPLGDVGPLLVTTNTDPAELAAHTLKFLRVQFPLRGHVTAYRDGKVFIDLGKKDGIGRGSTFYIKRHPGTINEMVATVQVTDTSDWYAGCEIQDQARGRQPQAGDVAVEDTSALLAAP